MPDEATRPACFGQRLVSHGQDQRRKRELRDRNGTERGPEAEIQRYNRYHQSENANRRDSLRHSPFHPIKPPVDRHRAVIRSFGSLRYQQADEVQLRKALESRRKVRA